MGKCRLCSLVFARDQPLQPKQIHGTQDNQSAPGSVERIANFNPGLLCFLAYGWVQDRCRTAGFLGRAYDDKTVQERIVKESALEWVIARPGILTNRLPTGTYRVLADPREWRNGFISRADVADFLVKQIDDDTYVGQTPVLVD